MYFKFNHGVLCNIPGFFYPTTVMLIDNDWVFLPIVITHSCSTVISDSRLIVITYYRLIVITFP